MSNIETVDPSEMRDILESEKDERKIASYLRDNPRIVYWTLCPASGHTRYAFSEFPLGSEFKADFVLLNSYSGAWEAYFIELEPIDDQLFTKNRTPSQRLATAIRQIDDWHGYIERNLESVRRDLVRWVKKYDILGYSSTDNPCNGTGHYLADSNTVIWFKYAIVIGRSSMLNEEQRNLAGRYRNNHQAEVITYDRLLDLAERRYREQRD